MVRRNQRLHAQTAVHWLCCSFFNRLWHGMWLRKAIKNSIHARIKRLLFYWRCAEKVPKSQNFGTLTWTKAGWARLHLRHSPQSIKVSLTRVILYNKKNTAKCVPWLEFLVAAMWFEHMTLRVWKIKIGTKRHGWRGGCEAIEDGSFVWIKHIDKHNRLMKATTVRRFQTV